MSAESPGFATNENIRTLYETTRSWLVEHRDLAEEVDHLPDGSVHTSHLPSYNLAVPGETLHKVVPRAAAVLAVESEVMLEYCPRNVADPGAWSWVNFRIERSEGETISLNGPDYCPPWTADRLRDNSLVGKVGFHELLESLSRTLAFEMETGLDQITYEEYEALLSIAEHLDDLQAALPKK